MKIQFRWPQEKFGITKPSERPKTFDYWALQINIYESSKLLTKIAVKVNSSLSLKDKYFEFYRRVYAELCRIHDASLSYLNYSDALQTFSDVNMMDSDSPQKIIWLSKAKVTPGNIEACLAAAAMFKAILHFLRTNDRYLELDARFMYVFSLWQWFSLLKIVAGQKGTWNDSGKNFILNRLDQFTLDEFSVAYRQIDEVFRDPDFADAFKFINIWRVSHGEIPTGLLDQIMYAFVLMPINENDQKLLLLNQSISIPGFIENNKFDWQSVKLHPVFKGHQPAKVAVKRLVTHFSLPRYDFDASLNLAHLLKKNEPLSVKWITWLFIIILIAILGLPVIISNLGWPLDDTRPAVDSLLSSLAFVVFVIGFFGALVTVWTLFAHNLIIHLLLPRVWAGILAGYSILLIEEGSVKITCTIWGISGWLVLLLWGILIMVTGIYLYHDILPWAVDWKKAVNRLLQTFLITLVLAIWIGFIVVPLTTATFDMNCEQKCFKGIFPIGKLDFRQLSVFVPIAYLTGLVSQFIFEEKPLTTSVWAPQRN